MRVYEQDIPPKDAERPPNGPSGEVGVHVGLIGDDIGLLLSRNVGWVRMDHDRAMSLAISLILTIGVSFEELLEAVNATKH